MGTGDHILTGRRAEDRAAALLEGRGYRIVDRNYREARGELDIIAWDGEVLVFVEVRARHADGFGDVAESIGSSKRAALIRTARGYLRTHDLEEAPVRFDVVTFAGEDLERVHVIPDAFEVSDPWR
jgi:putative endonuclease